MIENLSNKCISWLLSQGVITEDEVTVYRYAAYNVLYAAIPVVMMLIIGIFIGQPLGSILFIATFILLRKYAGGFHFDSLRLCIIVSLVTEFLFLYLATFIYQAIVSFILIFISSLSILKLSPIVHINRPLDSSEIQYCKAKLKKHIVFLVLFCYCLYIIGYPRLISFPASAMIMTALVQYPAMLKRKGMEK